MHWSQQEMNFRMRKKLLLHWTIYLVIITGVFRCAHKIAPSGGPEDKTPPTVVHTIPAPDSVNVRHLEYIEIEFSENIKKTSLAGNYWLVPEVPGGLAIKWKGGRKLRLYPADSLLDNQTYVLTLGTGIKDLRGNGLEAPFQLAFSTSAGLDSGAIYGSVYSDKPEKEIYVYAYPLPESTLPDTFLQRKPRYYTQINSRGDFRFTHLPPGGYRVIALLDKDYDRVYRLGTDWIGIPFSDVHIDANHPFFYHLNLYLIKEDTTAPQIRALDTVSVWEIRLTFNEPIRFDEGIHLTVRDTAGQPVARPLAVSFDHTQPEKIDLFFRGLPPHRELELWVSGVRDAAGNPVIDSLQKTFTSPARKDTLPPRFMEISPPDGSEDVPYDARVAVSFNVPVDTGRFIRVFSLRDEKKRIVPGSFDFTDRRKPVFIPDTLLEETAGYTVEIRLDSLKDLFGRSFPDTLLRFQFITRNWADLGEISGMVFLPDTGWKQAIIEAQAVDKKKVYRTVVRVGKEYLLPFLPGGFYLLRMIVDVNENGEWDRGKTLPWRFSEPFLFKPDTVKVRKRWTTQGIDFEMNFRRK